MIAQHCLVEATSTTESLEDQIHLLFCMQCLNGLMHASVVVTCTTDLTLF